MGMPAASCARAQPAIAIAAAAAAADGLKAATRGDAKVNSPEAQLQLPFAMWNSGQNLTIREGIMFEEFEAEEKGQAQERNKLLKMTAIIVAALAVVGAIIYISTRGHASSAAQPAQHVAATPTGQAAANPVKDLKIIKAVMGRDPSGLRVMWSVQLKNQSPAYTYSNIQYQASFIGPDGSTTSSSRDTIKDSIAAGDEKKFPDFIGGVYDANASTYQFVIISADSAVE